MIIRLFSGKSLFARLLKVSLFTLALLTIVIGVFANLLVREVIKRDARDKLVAIAVVKEDNLNRWVAEQRRNVVFIAALPEVRSRAGTLLSLQSTLEERQVANKVLNEYLRTIVTNTSDTQCILFLDTGGKIVLSSATNFVGAYQTDEEYFQKGLSRTNVTPFYTSFLLGAPTITISTPLFDENGQRIGVLASHLSIAAVDQIIRERRVMGEVGESYLVNSLRQLITTDPLALQQNKSLYSAGIDAALAEQDNSDLYLNYDGVPVVGAYQWVEERGAAILIEVPQREVFAMATGLSMLIIGAGILCMAGSALLIYFLSLRLTAPIETLTHTATQIASGHFELTATVLSDDEVGELARAFNNMTARLNESLNESQELNQKLETRVAERTADLENTVRELEAFSYSVSHDLRAPLRAISGYARILESEHGKNLDADALSMLARVYANAIFMGKLVDDLLAFSRLGRQAIRSRIVSGKELGNMVDDIMAELLHMPAYANVEASVGNLASCYADPALIRQVFANLLSNAFKFSGQQTAPRVVVECVETPRGEAYVVRDNGVGFEMKYADKVFGVFHRLHRQDEFEGTGVGLAIVQRIVHRHGGHIWAEAIPGEGAAFFFTLGGKDTMPAEPDVE